MNSSYKSSLVALVINQALAMSVMTLVISMGGIVGYSITPHKELATLPISAQVMGTFLMLMPASYLSNLLGRRNGFLFGSAIGVIGGVIAYLSIIQQNFWMFCFGILLVGFQNAFAQYFRFSAIDITPAERSAYAVSLVMSGGVIAAFVGPSIGNFSRTFLPVEFSASGLAIAILCLIQFIIFFLFYRYRETKVKQTIKKNTDSFSLHLFKRIPFWTSIISGAIGFAVMTLIMNATPLTMQNNFGFSFKESSSIVQWHIFAMYFPSFFTGKIIKKINSINTIFLGIVLLFLCVLTAISGNSYTQFLIALVFLGIGWNFTYLGATYLLTQCTTENEKAFVQGFNDTFIYMCNVVGSVSSGVILAHLGWKVTNLIVVPILGINIVLLLFCKLKNNRDKNYVTR